MRDKLSHVISISLSIYLFEMVLVKSFRSMNKNEDKYEICPRDQLWYFVFNLVFVLT